MNNESESSSSSRVEAKMNNNMKFKSYLNNPNENRILNKINKKPDKKVFGQQSIFEATSVVFKQDPQVNTVKKDPIVPGPTVTIHNNVTNRNDIFSQMYSSSRISDDVTNRLNNKFADLKSPKFEASSKIETFKQVANTYKSNEKNLRDTIYDGLSDTKQINVNQIVISDVRPKDAKDVVPISAHSNNDQYHIVKSKNYYNKDEQVYRKGDTTLPRLNDKEIKDVFDCFDLNSGGSISASELRFILKQAGENPTDEEIDEMVKLADGEGDGQINYKSFHEFLSSCFQ